MKRSLEVIVSLIALVLISPILLVISVLVFCFIGRPILFTQTRTGLFGEVFQLYKFRTMSNARDAEGNLLPDHLRMGSFGRILRGTSLDELPTLLNIIKGDMSIVGPRPLLVEYLPLYSDKQARRHLVRPGLTGWAQINGRNAISWDEKFNLDVWYVDNQSLWLDIKIVLLTVPKIISREGVSAPDHATAPSFLGNSANNSN